MAGYTRRRFVATGLAAATTGAVAGCTSTFAGVEPRDDESRDDAGGTVAQSTFFVFGEFAAGVAGDTATAETLVPVGQHGHGWNPGPQIQGRVLDSDLLVYGMTGFQPWADDLVETLRADDADVDVLAAGGNVDLLTADHEHESSHGDAKDDGGDRDHADDAEDDHADDEHNDTDATDDEDEQAEHDDEHRTLADGADPHFWLDPVRAKTAVETVENGFAAVDDDNADVYADNAADYRARLDELDETFRSTLETASRDVVFVAGHNAVQYLGHRYGFEVATLTGLAADDQPTPKDVERAHELIAEHDLEYVCVDPLESRTAADLLVEETDATEVLPLTAIPGRTGAWVDEDWGYVDIMEQVNLETLQTVLDTA